MQAYQLRQAATFEEGVKLLGERLGPIRILVTQKRDEGFLTFALGSLDPELKIAFDFRHESWAGVELPENAVLVNEMEAKAPFRYLRFRDPPYTDKAIKRIADELRRSSRAASRSSPTSSTRTSRRRPSTRSGCSN